MSEQKEFKISEFETNKSLYIEASAGTGKTYTIQLMVAKMIAEGTPLKKILIVTYTEKAAGELKDRIRKKINEVLEKRKIDMSMPELSEDQLADFRKAYQDVDNAAIFTIHSFCQKALKEYAYDAGRPFDMTMIDDAAVEDCVEKLIRDRWATQDDFKDLFNFSDNPSSLIDKIKKLFVSAVNLYKGKDFAGNELVILDPVELPQFEGKELSVEQLEQIAKFAKLDDMDCFPGFQENRNAIEQVATSDEHSKGFLTELKAWEKGKSLYNGYKYSSRSLGNIPVDSFNYFRNLKELLGSVDETLLKVKRDKFVIENLPELFDEWQQYKAENKLQSFNDMILSVHKAVQSSDNLLKSRLRAQYKFAIIDEFQDTNQLQWDIFRKVFLTDDNTPDFESGYKSVPEHSIFVVGDPKQSIYSFQGADVNVYVAATKTIGHHNDLLCNFRSTDNVINGCTALFEGDFFKSAAGDLQISFSGSRVPSDDKKKAQPVFDGAPVNSIWLSEPEITPENFANAAVAQIIDWCSFDESGKTRLQVFDKQEPSKLKNVSFKDFAILAKSRSEMEIIESAMRSVGMPYMRYKEAKLFKSRECAEWIALFRAINAPDFSSWNRRLLSEVLITDFFRDAVSGDSDLDDEEKSSEGLARLYYAESETFDNPSNDVRMCIAKWRSLTLKHRYAELQERIYEDTKIEDRLMKVECLQGLSRLRQIGNYAIDYLYRNQCTLDDLIRHLEGLARYEESADDEDGDLVEKGSDFNAVQVMTIHASKGLEFPVVISVAGFRGYNKNSSAPYLYHDVNKNLHVGFGDTAKQARKSEELEEWKRLFYVDFTRASSILVLPRYKKWTEKDSKGNVKSPEFAFLNQAIESFATVRADDARFFKAELNKESKERVKKILKRVQEESLNDSELAEKVEAQKSAMTALQKELPDRAIMQFSYSNLSKNAKGEEETSEYADDNDSPVSKDGVSDDAESQKALVGKKESISLKDFDTDVVTKNCDTVDSRDEILGEDKYPRGSKIGDALHNVLERVHFKEFGESYKTLQQALENPSAELKNAIDEEFKAGSLPIEKNRDEWNSITIRYIWNTLNTDLPVIAGGTFVENAAPFKLSSLPLTDHKPEVRFDLNADIKNASDSSNVENEAIEAFALLHRVCKGFIDLLFVREVDGVKRYSILDWKSDTLENYSYENIKDKVDHEYSVQRVLYSYCLIQWLKQFYGKRKTKTGIIDGLDESQIFEKHFGGIYYAFLRGTVGGEKSPTSESSVCHGIYAQTWKNYAALEAAYKLVKDKLMGGNWG